jgi:hypothetical protein
MTKATVLHTAALFPGNAAEAKELTWSSTESLGKARFIKSLQGLADNNAMMCYSF